jgi:hypothetical protein
MAGDSGTRALLIISDIAATSMTVRSMTLSWVEAAAAAWIDGTKDASVAFCRP